MDTNTISLDRREERMAVPFQELGDRVKHKIANIQKIADEIYDQRLAEGLSMKIQINPVKERRYFDPHTTITWYKDPLTGIYFGNLIGFHSDGNPKWGKIPLAESLTLDLNLPEERKRYAILRWHPYMKDNPIKPSTEPIFYIYDPQEEADKIYKQSTEMIKAVNIAKTVPFKNLPMMLRALKIQFEDQTNERVLRSLLIQHAQGAAESFITFYKSRSKEWVEIFQNALFFGIIREDPKNGYMYHNRPLGMTETDCIVYIQENKKMLEDMKQDILAKDFVTQTIEAKFGADTPKEEEEDV